MVSMQTNGDFGGATAAPSREQQFLAVFQKVTRLTSLALDHQEVMDTIARGLPELLAIDACTIRLIDASIGSFVLGAAHGVSLEYLSRDVIDSEDTMAMIRSGYPVFSDHVDQDSFLPFHAAASREGVKSVLTLPILYKGALIGIMRLLTRSARSFSSEEISFAMALAEQVGIAISHGRMFKEMDAQLAFLREIQNISALVNSTLDLDGILNALVERATLTMRAKGCTLRLIDPESGQLQLAASHGVSSRYLRRGDIENEGGVRMVLAGGPVTIYDVSHDQRVDYRREMADEGIVSLLAVPVKVNREVIGVMRILTDAPRVFADAEVRFLVTLAEVGGTAIRNARNYGRINLLLEEISAHEIFLNDIINSLRHQVLVLDRNRRVVLANKVYLDAADKKADEVTGMEYRDVCRSADRACPVDQILEGLEMRPFVQEFRSDDQTRWFERTASPVFDADGQIEYVVEVIRDITSEHMLEAEKIQSGKLQGIVELAGAVAHEINSPLFAALGTADLLVEDCRQPELREELAVIVRNLKQIGELTRKMTTMTGYASQEYVGETKIVSFTQHAKDDC